MEKANPVMTSPSREPHQHKSHMSEREIRVVIINLAVPYYSSAFVQIIEI